VAKDMFAAPSTPFIPAGDALFSRVEPGAIGSVLVLVALIGGLGFGGWTVLQEVQKVQFAPVEQTPTVVTDVDPLAGAGNPAAEDSLDADTVAAFEAPSPEALDRLYRPQALEVPVLIARDGPIASLDPRRSGTLGPALPREPSADLVAAAQQTDSDPAAALQVTDGPAPAVQLVAVRPAWVRVKSADGSVIYEGIMDAGATFDVPATEDPATLRVGESGAVYFAVNGTHYGPAGPSGTVTSNLPLSVENLTTAFQVADLAQDGDLAAMVNVAEVQTGQ
jgi:hypothetical protein